MTSSQGTVIIWGAGATASLGVQTTEQQTETLQKLASGSQDEPLDKRVEEALRTKRAVDHWQSALCDLLTILDDDGSGKVDHAIKAMARNWCYGAGCPDLRKRIADLRTLYDWPALKAAIEVCLGADNRFRLNDLFNVLDMHGQSGHGFPVKGEFLTPQRVLGARNALKMLQQTMLYIDWQCGREENKGQLDLHYDFAAALGRRMQRLGQKLDQCNMRFDSRDWYMGDVSFACFNWDPIALWCQFVANRDLNNCEKCPLVGNGKKKKKMQIFHDLGHFVPGPRVEPKDNNSSTQQTPWHPMNESSARQLNDDDHGASVRIRVSKFLSPHGCLWWRECPNCGKLSSYMGDTWDRDSRTLIPPPPLKAFVQDDTFKSRLPKELEAWKRGEVDARACIDCDTLTYAHHTQMIMQSSFKSPPPPFLEEIKRNLRVAVQNAHHIVLMGYTLPQDDVDYRAFLAARRRHADDSNDAVKCSVVVGRKRRLSQWLGPKEWPRVVRRWKTTEPPRSTLIAACDLFGAKNVRFYGGGIPNVFLDGGSVTDAAVERLLTWEDS